MNDVQRRVMRDALDAHHENGGIISMQQHILVMKTGRCFAIFRLPAARREINS
jgi:hypothetical protein